MAGKGSRWPQAAAAGRLPAISLFIRASVQRLVVVSSGRGELGLDGYGKRNLEEERIQKEISYLVVGLV